MKTTLLITAVAFLIMGAGDRLSASLIISIDQTGGNDPVNVNNSRVWNFGITEAGAAYFAENGLTFDSALFDAKVHKKTVEPLVFTLYSGLGGNVNGNTVVAQTSVAAEEFTQQYSGGLGDLMIFAPQLLASGYYSVTLTTKAADKATTEYFLKKGKLVLLDSDQTTLDSLYWVQDQSAGNATSSFNGSGSLSGGGGNSVLLVPEMSATWALLGLVSVSLGGTLLRRYQNRPAMG